MALALAAAAGLSWVKPWDVKPKSVVMETMTPGPVTRVLAVNGRVAARRTIAVRSPVAGEVVEVAAAEERRSRPE
ncbi:MAG: hypothetical protein IPL47_14330 [Phyllobacteriaceae bacterium]|nr:hypothetical protein [Phyllobacteriaceae bacterium]